MNNRDLYAFQNSDPDGLRSTSRDTMVVGPGNAEFKLVRINDGFAGESFPLVEHINTIGRIDENTILLSHKSISRNHAQIIRNGSSHRIVDLDSSNGTFYNGKRIHRAYPTNLAEGGIIQFGSIEFVFVPVDSDVDPKTYAQSSTKWLLLTGMGILFLLFIAGASIGFTLYENNKIEAASEQQEPTLEAKATKLVEIGKKQLDAGDWRGASKTFETISSLLPNHPEAARLRQRAQLELEAEQTYDKAGAAIEKGELTRARELLQGIPLDTEAKRRALSQLPRVEEKLSVQLTSEAESLMDLDTPADLKKAYNLLAESIQLEPPPKSRSKKAIRKLVRLYRAKRMKFTPIDLSGGNDE